jgi:hypothetical protein
MAGIKIDVNAATLSTANPMPVAPTADLGLAGFEAPALENDDGLYTGTRTVRAADIDRDWRTRVSMNHNRFSDFFPGSLLNLKKWKQSATTMTIVVGGNCCALNAGASVATATYAAIETYAVFPITSSFGTWARIPLQLSSALVANNVVEVGLQISATNAAATDGVFMRLSALGVVSLVCVINSVEVVYNTNIALFNWATAVGNNHTVTVDIYASETYAELWIDNQKVAEGPRPTDAYSTSAGNSYPVKIRTINTAATGSAQIVRVGNVGVSMETSLGLDAPTTACIAGDNGDIITSGNTPGQTATYVNNANPTAALPTNTTAALPAGLGGQVWETDTVASGTDCIIFSFLNPAAAPGICAKNLVIYGVWIDSYVQTVLVGGGYVAQWCIAYGHTTVSLATADGVGTRAPVRKALGCQTVVAAAAANTILTRIYQQFLAPIVVEPGCYVQLVKKKVGTTSTSGVIAHLADFDHCWL